jgi:hypothetical protein
VQKSGKNLDAVVASAKQTWEPVQKKLDEKGVTQAVKVTGEKLYGISVTAAKEVNQRVEANPTLKSAKDSTVKGITQATSYINKTFGTYFGWGQKPA